MPMKYKFPAAAALMLGLAASSVALAAGGATATHDPARPKVGQTVEILVKGMKPGERVKGRESLPYGQSRTVYPKRPANGQGAIIFAVKAQIRGTHKWVFTGRRSHRTARTKYYVRG